MTKRKPLEERLWSRVVEKSGCWVYTGTVSRYGYGRISSGGRHGRVLDVHRVVYELLVADVPPGLQLDHLCRNRACCNPYHLEPVTQKENIRRGLYGSPDTHPGAIAMRAKTHCPEGHPYRGENLYVDPRGYRGCRACRRAAGSRRRSQGGGSRNA